MNFYHDANKISLLDEHDKTLAEITFPDVNDHTVNIDHTFVDDSLRGQGVAGKLVKAAAEQIKSQNKKAVLTCSYAVKWFAGHPEYDDLLQ